MMAKTRVGVLISGRGSNMAALIYASRRADCPYEIVVVGANVPDAPGLQLAAAEGVAVFSHDHRGLKRAQFDTIIDTELARHGVEILALAGYMRLLSDHFVTKWAGRCLNIHPSLLPSHKGLDVHAAVLAAGETVTGCTVHLVTPDLDGGPILGQVPVAVLPGDTAQSLATRVQYAEHQLYPAVLAKLIFDAQSPASRLARLRALALALPETDEKLSHGSPGFFVRGGKFFAYFSFDHHHDGVMGLLVKASGVEEQAQLIENDPDLYYRPAYFGSAGWIGIRLDRGDVDWNHVGDWLLRSWRASAPRRLGELMAI